MARDRFGFLERHRFVNRHRAGTSKVAGHYGGKRIRFLVALAPVPDLLFYAKHLFVAAMVAIAPTGRSRMSRPGRATDPEERLSVRSQIALLERDKVSLVHFG
jgi:hypothetical protein